MKRNTTRFLLVLMMLLSLCFLCTACGGSDESVENSKSPESSSSTISPQKNPNEGRGDIISEITADEAGLYKGFWLGTAGNQYDIGIDEDGNWQLYSNGDVIDDGYLLYDTEGDTTYIYSYQTGAADGGWLELDGQQLYITTIGYFDYSGEWDGEGRGDIINNGNGGSGNREPGYYSWDSELCQRNVSEFEGVWYLNGDPSEGLYIIIDDDGNWGYFQCAPGGGEATEMDHGVLTYSADEVSTYYANSSMYADLAFRVFELDEGIIIWNDDETYYRIEEGRGDVINNGGGNQEPGYYTWDSELCQRNVSEFEGVWYYDGDLSALTFIVIDDDGNWSYYQRAPGDAEATQMDGGVLTYSADEVSTYYANSSMYADLAFRVFEFDEGVIIWGDDGAYYRME